MVERFAGTKVVELHELIVDFLSEQRDRRASGRSISQGLFGLWSPEDVWALAVSAPTWFEIEQWQRRIPAEERIVRLRSEALDAAPDSRAGYLEGYLESA